MEPIVRERGPFLRAPILPPSSPAFRPDAQCRCPLPASMMSRPYCRYSPKMFRWRSLGSYHEPYYYLRPSKSWKSRQPIANFGRCLFYQMEHQEKVRQKIVPDNL